MKKRTIITIALMVAVAITGVLLGSFSPLNNKSHAQRQIEDPIPDHVLYERVFRLTVAFHEKAEEQRLSGVTVTAFESYFQEKGELSAKDTIVLLDIATQFKEQADSIDTEAYELIEQLQQNSVGGYIQPPPQLLALQKEKDDTALIFRDQLISQLGGSAFERFDNFVKGEFAEGITVISLSDLN